MSPTATAAIPRRRSGAEMLVARAPISSSRGARIGASYPGLVPRIRLIHRLSGPANPRLVLIVAPPGFGKSSLLSEWARRDRRRFVRLAPGTGPWAQPADHPRSVLVVDDAERIPARALRELVETSIRDLPEGSTLALASRSEPALALGRLRANRALVEIRTRDLCMTPGEASLLLRGAGVELDLPAVQTLVQRTEGWPAALYLAALSIRQQEDPGPVAAGAFRGDDHLLAQYLRDEVLSQLPADLLEFALLSSVLDELSGPFCDAVLDRRDSGLLLTALAQSTPLLHALDPARTRYRWHVLVRDALEAELRRDDPDRAPALHLRASAWHRTRASVDEAISHAVRADDPALTGELLRESLVAYLTQGRNEIVQRWLGHFSREERTAHPALALAAAYSFLVAGEAAEARHHAAAVQAAIERGERVSSAAGVAGFEAMVAPDGVAAMVRAAARACALEPRDSPWRPLHLFLHGAAKYLNGDQPGAERLLDEAAALGAATQPVVTSLCLAQAAMIALEREGWDTACDLTDRAARVIQVHGLRDYPPCALVFAASAAVRAREGRADEAKQDLRQGIELLTSLGDFVPWYGAEARILLARASLWLADVVAARALLAEASRLARRIEGAAVFQRWFDDAWSYIDGLAETHLGGPSSLTIAELRILRFLPSHRSFREIGAQLGVSANTVKSQAHSVYRKLGAASRSEAVSRALDAGLLGQ